MTVGEFHEAVAQIRRRYGGWVTSAGRTDLHSVTVGGFAGDPHTWDLGADVMWHARPDIVQLTIDAAELGLKVIREELKPHDHFQPDSFPAGPVTVYQGETKSWA